MRCSNCNAELKNNAKFCTECGTAVKNVSFCHSCGAENDPLAKFCTNCGAAMGGAGESIEKLMQKAEKYDENEDYEKAFYWYEKAAQQGYASGQYNLGVMYDNGDGIPQDKQKALYWYEKAAQQGYANAQCNLGIMYDNGDGIPQDKQKVFYWYEKAAKQGDENAQKFLDENKNKY
ncbi:MAG: zinc-ribbon domain-containing protein [Elusimicrobiota bacterium]|jgi:ribosomal protein L40E|nr:zinc-ribbon domain-containing protein [Elusimicrobiota bacterium]